MELTDLRAQLDEVDAQLTDLFVRRMQLIDTVADLKQRDPSRPLYDPVRERAILMKVREKAGAEYGGDCQGDIGAHNICQRDHYGKGYYVHAPVCTGYELGYGQGYEHDEGH